MISSKKFSPSDEKIIQQVAVSLIEASQSLISWLWTYIVAVCIKLYGIFEASQWIFKSQVKNR